jgi:BirA family transcriptional regulator, biotin operon repressor / biotin---[acetyl-CoA-carboxylase] ligase
MKRFKSQVIRYASLPSTNTEAARLAAQGAEEGLCIVADEQTAGRGRLQRSWLSPKGAGIYFSTLLRPLIPLDQWPLITFVAALAVSDALRVACDLETDIKWPNDLLAGERKICGILAEAIETPQGRAVVVGIGINLTKEAFSADLSNVASSVAEATTRHPEKESILAALVQAIADWYSVLQETGGQRKILEAWAARSSYAEGKSVRVISGDDVICGITRGVESDGALRVETSATEVRIIRTGDVASVRPAS